MVHLQAKDHERLLGNHQKPGRDKEVFPYRFQREHGHSANIFVSVASRLWENKFMLFKTSNLWYFAMAAPRILIQRIMGGLINPKIKKELF